MATRFRIVGSGHRRRLGDGRVRSIGAVGSRYTDVAGRTSVGIGNSARATALAGMIGETLLSFQLHAEADSAGVIGLARLDFYSSGQLSARVNVSGRAQFGIGTAGRLSVITPVAGAAVITLSAIGRMSNVVGIGGRARADIGTVGMLGVRQILRGRAPLSFAVTGVLSVSSSAVFREVWRDYYDKRAALLLAIDESNRLLAREANNKADANAQAIVQTRAEVKRVDDRVTSEASRTTLLTGRVTNAETQQGAHGRAIDSLTTTQTAQGRTIDSHTQQLTSVQASITDVNGKTLQLANANQVLEARVHVNEQGVAAANARWGVYFDINGNISGVESGNDGKRSWFRVVADVFELVATGSLGAEFRRRGNSTYYLRFYAQAVQLIIGINFGAASNFLAWFGPNVGEQGCTRANGTAFADTSGSAHFGGSLSAGILKNSAQTTVLTANPRVEVGPFTTNGRPKQVTVGYSANSPVYTQYFPGRPENNPPPSPGDPQGPTSLVIVRRLGSNPNWVALSSTQISHGSTITGAIYIPNDASDPNLPLGGWRQDYYWSSSASVTLTDTVAGTENVTYAATAESPLYQRIQQSLSVLSVEE